MIDYQALFSISYGLYIVCSGDEKKGNGYISNTVFQVTSEPPRFATCCNKDNLTCDMIETYGCFTVSVLKQEASANIIGKFGFKSGQDIDKLDEMNIRTGRTGAPIVLDESIALLEVKVSESLDVGSHMIFIGELVSAEVLEESEPLTYAYYREKRKGLAPKNAPTYIDKSLLKSSLETATQNKTAPPEAQAAETVDDAKKTMGEKEKYKCPVCGYVYDEHEEDVAFADLPDDWTCPICGVEKDDFIQL